MMPNDEGYGLAIAFLVVLFLVGMVLGWVTHVLVLPCGGH